MRDTQIGSIDFLLGLHRVMTRIRLTEERIAALIEAKAVKTPCHLCIGHEAVAAGVCAALERDDSIWGGHRSHGHYLAKGGSLEKLLAEVLGRATGCSRGRGGSMHLVAPEVGLFGTVPIVGATIPLAVGAGLASKLRGDRRVAVAFFGDGATEEGHFHESLNLAALYRLPVVFVCENNLYSTHMAIKERRPMDNIVESAGLYGMPGLRIDGNDVIMVYESAREAVSRARAGNGPSLIECRTYRWRGHVGPAWDLDVGETRRHELEEWLTRDPIEHLRHRMGEGAEVAETIAAHTGAAEAEIEDALRSAQEAPAPDQTELLQHVYGSRSDGPCAS